MKKKVGILPAIAIVALLLPAITFGSPALCFSAGEDWSKVAGKIEDALMASLKTYEAGDKAGGVEGVSDAYFEVFESAEANMEIAVRRYVSVKTARILEMAFNEIRKGMHKGKDVGEVSKMVKELVADIKVAARVLDKKGIGYGVGF